MEATYVLLVRWFPEIAGWPAWAITLVSAALPALACFTFVSLGPIIYVYAERKISAFMIIDPGNEAKPALELERVDQLRLAALALANIVPLFFWDWIEGWARSALVLYAGR